MVNFSGDEASHEAEARPGRATEMEFAGREHNEYASRASQASSSRPSRPRSKFASTTRVFTAHITQQEIMRQVTKDEELSGDASILTKSLTTEGDVDKKTRTGEALLARAIEKERKVEAVRRTANMLTKDLKQSGISRRNLLRAVIEDERQFQTCLTLPMTILFAAFFILFFQMHYPTSNMYLNETSIRNIAAESAFACNTAEDIFNWMEDTMFPWLWSIPNVPGYSADSSSSDAKSHLLVGGVLITTGRSKKDLCEDLLPGGEVGNASFCFPADEAVQTGGDTGYNLTNRRLVGADGGDALNLDPRRLQLATKQQRWSSKLARALSGDAWDSRSFRYVAPRETNADVRAARLQKKAEKLKRKAEFSQRTSDRQAHRIAQARAGVPKPLRRMVGPQKTRKQDEQRQRRLKELLEGFLDEPVTTSGFVYRKAIPMSLTKEQVSEQIDALRASTDRRTLYIDVNFITRNEDYELVTTTRVTFMFNRGGGVLSIVSMQSNRDTMGNAELFSLLVFVLALLRVTVHQVIVAVVSARRGSLRVNLLKMTVVMDWIMIVGGWGIVILAGLESLGMMSFINDWDEYVEAVKDLAASKRQDIDYDYIYKFHDSIASTNNIAQTMITYVGCYTVLLVGNYLIATMGHPRLAIIVSPLIQGASDLIHLAFVFMLVFLSFVLSGHILMGMRMEELSTFKASFGYCLQIVFQRQYDYPLMTAENMFGAAVWIVLFVLCLVLVLVNLMLAMIFDHYAAVRDRVGQDETVIGFLNRLLVQLRMQSAWNSNTDLLVKFAQIPHHELPTVRSVKRMFPDISEEQLDMVFTHATRRIQQKLNAETKHALAEFVAGLLLLTRDFRKGFYRIIERSTDDKTEPSKDWQAALQGESPPPPVLEVAEEQEAEEYPPLEKPDWVHNGVLVNLGQQREGMRELLNQMEALSARMESRGIRGGDVPLSRPSPPSLMQHLAFTEPGKDVSKDVFQEKDASKQRYDSEGEPIVPC